MPSDTYEPGRCGTCRHWRRREADDWSRTLRLRVRPDEEADQWEWDSAYQQRVAAAEALYGECQVIDLPGDDLDGDDLPLAYAQDGSDYVACLMTRAEFGCLLHELTHEKGSTDA